jgi:hypothetical protein
MKILEDDIGEEGEEENDDEWRCGGDRERSGLN